MPLFSSCINSSWCTCSQLEHEKRGWLECTHLCCDSYHRRRISQLALHFFKYFRRSVQSWFLKKISAFEPFRNEKILLLLVRSLLPWTFTEKNIKFYRFVHNKQVTHLYAMKHTHTHTLQNKLILPRNYNTITTATATKEKKEFPFAKP